MVSHILTECYYLYVVSLVSSIVSNTGYARVRVIYLVFFAQTCSFSFDMYCTGNKRNVRRQLFRLGMDHSSRRTTNEKEKEQVKEHKQPGSPSWMLFYLPISPLVIPLDDGSRVLVQWPLTSRRLDAALETFQRAIEMEAIEILVANG